MSEFTIQMLASAGAMITIPIWLYYIGRISCEKYDPEATKPSKAKTLVDPFLFC